MPLNCGGTVDNNSNLKFAILVIAAKALVVLAISTLDLESSLVLGLLVELLFEHSEGFFLLLVILCFFDTSCSKMAGAQGFVQVATGHMVARPLPEAEEATGEDSAEGKDASDEVDIPPEVLELFGTLRGEAIRRLKDFQPIHLFSLCWAYSTARLLDDDMRLQVTRAALHLGRTRDEENSQEAAREQERPEPGEMKTGLESPYVVQESDHWMALFKPAHWQVSVDAKEATKMASATLFEDDEEGDEEVVERPRVQAWIHKNMSQRYPICTDPAEAYGLLHRLDAQTSGVLVCAKSYVGAYWLRLQWCQYSVDKEYVCVVHGWVDHAMREIHKRIRVEKRKAPNSRRTISTHCTVGSNGKPSFTELVTLAHLERPGAPEERYSLVALKLHTGRTHQIRVHMQSIGHPLITDAKYAEDRLNDDKQWCPRNFLHTYRLAFRDVPNEQDLEASGYGPVRELVTPLPVDLRETLALLKPVAASSQQHYEDWLSGEATRLRAFERLEPAEPAESQ
ncbi:Rpusd1 [Symbiodinium pilosum]|uniref:Rpusd1 protein n=1 Tax=Symbiodinium pilosum TaxID=2952 RepID=A0A812PDX8_SYMPI|nr:Rpusd1 [Symbiodinium pilosum]